MRMRNPPHPGSVLRDCLGTMSVTDAAGHLGLSRILNGSAGISADMALRLAKALGTSPTCGLECSPNMTCGGPQGVAAPKCPASAPRLVP
jgi:antitoxin HigA-1